MVSSASESSESLETYRQAYAQKDGMAERVTTKDLRWEAPKEHFVKVNWDASIDKNSRKMGVGIIFKDSMGDVLATLLTPKDFIT